MSRSISLMLTLTCSTDVLFYELRPETGGGGDEFEKHPLHYVSLLGWEFYARPAFFFDIFSGDPHFDALIIGL